MVTETSIRHLANSLGADLVGFADVSCLPVEVTEGLTRAVSMAVALDPAVMRDLEAGPTTEYFAEYKRANALLNRLSGQVADLLRDAGYEAHAFQATTEQIDEITLAARLQHRTVATRAALGWIGKSGLVITEEYGSAVRLASVLTDAPVQAARPVEASRCGDCRRCVERCPARAIAGVHWQPGMAREHLYDPAACLTKARELAGRRDIKATICGICISVCPWTQRYLARKPAEPKVHIVPDGWQPQAQLGDGPPCERGSAYDQGPTIPKAFGLEAATRRIPASHARFEAQIVPATTENLDAVRELFQEYEACLPFDLSFQDFRGELAGLPGRYAPPSGRLLLAGCGGTFVGCVALRQIGNGVCEMKRLFVQPAFRGRGIGRALAQAVVEEARRIGYKRMRLDTVLEPAKSLYRSLGFREIPPYQHVPIEGVVFMELEI